MKLWGTRLFQTVVGKTIAGVVVVTVGVGAAAAGGADVPLLRSAVADESDEVDETGEDEIEVGEPGDGEPVDGDSEDGEPGDGESEQGEDAGEPADGQDEADENDDEDDGDDDGVDDGDELASASVENDDVDPNHGEIVSTFTQTTQLTGCEKGQATAAVARGEVDPTVPADELDELLAPFLERCARDGDEESEPSEEDDDPSAEGWKQTRDEGRAAVHEARQAFIDACGDDDDEAGDAAAADGDDDDVRSPECEELHAAAKKAHDDWKAAWHAERDAAKGKRGPAPVETEPESDAVSAPADAPGPPDHAKAKGKRGADHSSTKGNGKSKGNGKP